MQQPKLSRRSFLLAASTLVLGACSSPATSSSDQAESGQRQTWASDETVHLVATIYPMADFATKVAGEHGEVMCLVPAGTEPHDWEPTPDDIVNIQSADLVICNGAGMDDWVNSAITSLGSDAPKLVDASEKVKLRTVEGATDPHVWLSPTNAATQASVIASALAEAKPEFSNDFHGNMTEFVAQLGELDQEFAARLTKLPHHDIVVSHEAYGYLCDAYGLNQIGIEGLSPDSEPDAARMAEIVDLVKEKGITTIFFEELVSPKVAETIASETGAEAVELSPLEGLTDEQLAAGEDYLSVMRENLDKLEKALK